MKNAILMGVLFAMALLVAPALAKNECNAMVPPWNSTLKMYTEPVFTYLSAGSSLVCKPINTGFVCQSDGTWLPVSVSMSTTRSACPDVPMCSYTSSYNTTKILKAANGTAIGCKASWQKIGMQYVLSYKTGAYCDNGLWASIPVNFNQNLIHAYSVACITV
jgi:hypothetical protein